MAGAQSFDESFDVVILGGGLAGAATAFFLTRARGVRVALLEQEATLAVHSSGRNAGLIRRSSGDPTLDPLCDEGADFLAAPPADFLGTTGFRRTGSFLVVTPEVARSWARPGVVRASRDALATAVPPFVVPDGAELLYAAADGVADPRAVVAGFIESARRRGADVRLGVGATALEIEGGAVVAVRAGSQRLRCGAAVDASGAWASRLPIAAGVPDPRLRPMRRHLLVTAPDARVDARWPWVWDTVRGFYFRPERGGLLLCACDESPQPAGDCPSDPLASAVIRAKLRACLPLLGELPADQVWAGHRTLRRDGRFVLGADPTVKGLFWAAGLGGHGLTGAAAVGRIVASAITSSERPSDQSPPLPPP